ncbi:retinol dehydrogenase 13-like [Aricia agestis]|uniref:retinol dehydrogenase 13-like n=1 Tax=Aricia agestis TaxID=91739 RepID=UPI001C202DDF|nr:retinol dehydrogenase 13-like [Aricia agestis]
MFLVVTILLIIILILVLALYCKKTAGQCENSKHLVGKVVIVTGGSSGIGFEAAMDLAQRGARVIVANRNQKNGTDARAKIIAGSGNNDVYYYSLDLTSFKSVRKFANNVLCTEERLDVLINNAGMMNGEHKVTEDGLVAEIQANYFGPFLLTNLLLPLLMKTPKSRIVNVSSVVYKLGRIDLDDLNLHSKSWITKYFTYATTKLYIMLMTVELDRRLRGSGVTVNVVHPGYVATNILIKDGSVLKKIGLKMFGDFVKTARMGAQTIIYLAVSPEVTDVSGCYFEDCKLVKLNRKANDMDVARKLWDKSLQLVHLE